MRSVAVQALISPEIISNSEMDSPRKGTQNVKLSPILRTQAGRNYPRRTSRTSRPTGLAVPFHG
jgi:hypothetical protein